jgi:hypothetical protein
VHDDRDFYGRRTVHQVVAVADAEVGSRQAGAAGLCRVVGVIDEADQAVAQFVVEDFLPALACVCAAARRFLRLAAVVLCCDLGLAGVPAGATAVRFLGPDE